VALAAACRAWVEARRAANRYDALEAALLEALQCITDVQESMSGLDGQVRGLAAGLDRLQLRRTRSAGPRDRAGFDEAIALSRRGADARELVDACGLSAGEARLIKVLYGSAAGTTDPEIKAASDTH
jgi:hypothetical protein